MKRPRHSHAEEQTVHVESPPRIIGGDLRGRKLAYSGDVRTRPMKDRVRQAVFDLVGTDVIGKQAIDLFAGTGALAFEALSRGAASAILVEKHVPTARLIERNAADLGLEAVTRVVIGDTFYWAERLDIPASPPFDFYTDRPAEMSSLLNGLAHRAPAGSVFVVEADERFDLATLPDLTWDVRTYHPAVVAVSAPKS